jgi:hypothetical protein
VSDTLPRPIRYGIHDGETYVVDPEDLGFCAGDIVKAPGSRDDWKVSEIVSRPWRVANLTLWNTHGTIPGGGIGPRFRTGVPLSELLFVRRPANIEGVSA